LGRAGHGDHVDKRLEADPAYHDARNFLAILYFSAKRFDEAREQFERIPLEAQNDPVSVDIKD